MEVRIPRYGVGYQSGRIDWLIGSTLDSFALTLLAVTKENGRLNKLGTKSVLNFVLFIIMYFVFWFKWNICNWILFMVFFCSFQGWNPDLKIAGHNHLSKSGILTETLTSRNYSDSNISYFNVWKMTFLASLIRIICADNWDWWWSEVVSCAKRLRTTRGTVCWKCWPLGASWNTNLYILDVHHGRVISRWQTNNPELFQMDDFFSDIWYERIPKVVLFFQMYVQSMRSISH